MLKAWIEPFYDLENQVCAAYRCAPLAWAAGSHYSTILAACLSRDPGKQFGQSRHSSWPAASFSGSVLKPSPSLETFAGVSRTADPHNRQDNANRFDGDGFCPGGTVRS